MAGLSDKRVLPGTTPVERIDLTCSHRNCEHAGTYEMPVSCSNCGLTGIGVYTRGHETSTHRCPNCDTTNVRVNWTTKRELVA